MKIKTELTTSIHVRRFDSLRKIIDFSPPYQREGGVWDSATQAGLIDSIINGLDVPKLYFEAVSNRTLNPDGLTYRYAVIDGKQRLEAVSKFIDGTLSLPHDFVYFENETLALAGMTLTQVESSFPELARKFWNFTLPIVLVTTDSGDLIEEMFQRLNAASSLNAAERRNSISGATRTCANRLAEHRFLVAKSPIRNARYKYRELASKFLAIEHQFSTRQSISDTKADTLFRLFRATHGTPGVEAISENAMLGYKSSAAGVLDAMSSVFEDNDPLLASIGTVVVYYVMFRALGTGESVMRDDLAMFEQLRRAAARMPEGDSTYPRIANVRLREYNVLVQSTNDGSALERRAEIMAQFLRSASATDPLSGLDILDDAGLVVEGDEDGEWPSSSPE